jgi:SAM-dependent methyltransferase
MKSGTENFFKMKMSGCPACSSKKINPWLIKSKEQIQFSLWHCSSCHTGFMNPQPTKEYLDSIYYKSGHGLTEPISFEEVIKAETEYPNATVDAKRLVGQAKIFMAAMDGLKALDIGSGYGFFTNAALRAGFKVSAVNPGKWENEIFEKLNGFSPAPQFFEEVDFGPEKFDLVILSQVLEHVEVPVSFLVKIRSILKKNGIIAVAVPNPGLCRSKRWKLT